MSYNKVLLPCDVKKLASHGNTSRRLSHEVNLADFVKKQSVQISTLGTQPLKRHLCKTSRAAPLSERTSAYSRRSFRTEQKNYRRVSWRETMPARARRSSSV